MNILVTPSVVSLCLWLLLMRAWSVDRCNAVNVEQSFVIPNDVMVIKPWCGSLMVPHVLMLLSSAYWIIPYISQFLVSSSCHKSIRDVHDISSGCSGWSS